MNAKMQSVQSQGQVKSTPANENKWREGVTSSNISAGADYIKKYGLAAFRQHAAEVMDLAPYRIAPRYSLDNAINERAFSTGDMRHHMGWLEADTRNIDKMWRYLNWLRECRGNLVQMESKLKEDVRAFVNRFTLAAQNAFTASRFAQKNYKGGDAKKISELTLQVEQAQNYLRTVASSARAAADADAAIRTFTHKVEGMRKAIKEAGDIDAAIERIDAAGRTILAKRTLAGLIQPILEERIALLAEQKAAAAEVQAIIASACAPAPTPVVETPVTPPPQRKSKSTVKVLPKSRGEVTAHSLADIGTALVHKQVDEVSAKRITKEQAIELAGVPADVFEEAALKAEMAEQEEVLISTESKAIIFVRRVGNTRRFFVKQ